MSFVGMHMDVVPANPDTWARSLASPSESSTAKPTATPSAADPPPSPALARPRARAQTFDPFKLTREGDMLRGRGTTDCLGHVALVALLMEELGRSRPPLERSVVAVFIANEENSRVLGIGRAAGGPAPC